MRLLLDFSYVLHKLIDPHLEVPKHFRRASLVVAYFL